MKHFALVFALLLCSTHLFSRTLDVGVDKQFTRLQQAAAQAKPGDTICIYDGIYTGGDFIQNLHGTEQEWITIRAATKRTVFFYGGTQAFHLSSGSYLRIEGLSFGQQTGNGVNIDDGGNFTSPTHHIIIENCEWESMNATGNNDELKLSGIDDFVIRNCIFSNGSEGGSLVDMVGCHRGVFERNTFTNAGSNCIQAKGGTSEIVIQRNKFINGGQRAVNIGGSTGLQFFRPQGANYEAKSIEVYSNIFVGSVAPIAFVGATECKVINNTIIRPTRWAVRILQETTGSAFLPCGNNSFTNNIILYGNTGTVAINVGSNTAPESFVFGNNLWYNPENTSWTGPNTPVVESNSIFNLDPLFLDTINYSIGTSSPAWKAGLSLAQPTIDYVGKEFSEPRAIGASEVQAPSSIMEDQTVDVVLYPNPVTNILNIQFRDEAAYQCSIELYSLLGVPVVERMLLQPSEQLYTINCNALPSGLYIAKVQRNTTTRSIPFTITR